MSFVKFKTTLFVTASLLILPLLVIKLNQNVFAQEKIEFNIQNAQNYQEQLKSNKIKPVEEILEVNLFYKEGATPEVKVDNLQRQQGYPQKYKQRKDSYKLEVLDNDENVVETIFFKVPKEVESPPPLPGEDPKKAPDSVVQKEIKFTLALRWDEKFKRIKISKDGNLITESEINNVEKVNNAPNFKSIKGDEFLSNKKQSSNILKFLENLLIKEASAAGGNGTLDIVFISEDFSSSQMNTFHQNVNDYIAHMLTFEPFKTRASQITFHFVDNTSDLGCVYYGRLLTCDTSLAYQAAYNAAVPVDQLVVVVNNDTYGGAGYLYSNMATTYNGYWGSQVATHELGHALGDLDDEYVYDYNSTGWIDNTAHANCFAGNPPASEWINLVALGDYGLGCDYPNWYAPSANSIMRSIDSYYFNSISQKLLSQNIDFYSGTYSNNSAPTTSISSPISGNLENKTYTIFASATDDQGVSRVELWVNDILQKTLYLEPFHFSWSPPNLTTNYKLQTKVFDSAGNSGVSQAVNLNVNGGNQGGNNQPDTTAPVVNVTGPANNSLVDGRVTLKASASDNQAVSKVEFYVDNQLLNTDQLSPYSVKWDTKGLPQGLSHLILAKAYDSAGNTASSQITLIIKDTIDPVVIIKSPANKATVNQGQVVTVNTQITDNVAVFKVEYFVNRKLVCAPTPPGQSCQFTVTSDMSRLSNLEVKAVDKSGNDTSSKIRLTVNK